MENVLSLETSDSRLKEIKHRHTKILQAVREGTLDQNYRLLYNTLTKDLPLLIEMVEEKDTLTRLNHPQLIKEHALAAKDLDKRSLTQPKPLKDATRLVKPLANAADIKKKEITPKSLEKTFLTSEPPGEVKHPVKRMFSDEEVLKIRKESKEQNISERKLAQKLNIARSHAHYLLKGKKSYKHLPVND